MDWELNLCCPDFIFFRFADPRLRWNRSSEHRYEWDTSCPEWPLHPGLSAAHFHHREASAKHHRCCYNTHSWVHVNVLPTTASFYLPPGTFPSLSSGSAGEWGHTFFWLAIEVGHIQKASQFRPQRGRRRCSHYGVRAEGAGSSSHSSDPPGFARHPDGAGFPPPDIPHRCLGPEQPAAEERHVLL